MSQVLAAIGRDRMADAVLSTANAVAGLFAAQVKAVHVGAPDATLAAAARGAGVPLDYAQGEPATALAHAAAAADVAAIVIGARGEPAGDRLAGSTALSLITLQRRPVVVVPPNAAPPGAIESVLVPLDGTAASTTALQEVVELAHDSALQIVVAHVRGPHALPAFSDQLAHEVRAWREEFIARHCPGAIDATLEVRVGEPHERVLEVLRETGCDLVALGWRQDLAGGRAAVVRRLLAQAPVPVLLTPVDAARTAPAETARR